MASPSPLVQTDVQDLLLKTKLFRRRRGEVPYPLKYTREMANFDIWDNMFFQNCCKSLTMHQFVTPPTMVLDLGCGGGYWAIEAAKQWPNCNIVGFDIADIQPKLSSIPPYRHLAHQVQWVHGNFLDGLPFPPLHFDFVRVVGIGLAVPEDEWQYLIEEITRVMKHGAVIEIIEEDIIFPCSSLYPRLPSAPPPIAESPSLGRSTVYSASSSTILSKWSDSTKSSLSPPSLRKAASSSALHTLVRSTSPEYFHTHPQDHTRLKAAWDSMLTRRFISASLLSVLPFHISSAFIDVQSHPPYKVSLPPNSGIFEQDTEISTLSNDSIRSVPLKPSASSRSINSDGFSVRSKDANCQANDNHHAAMHLAKTVNTVKACKEAMWQEYERLYPEDPISPVMRERSATTRSVNSVPEKSTSLEAFEDDWKSWENDMEDRIGLRKRMQSIPSWCSSKLEEGEKPDWRVWREMLDGKESNESGPGVAAVNPDELCRSIRSFVGWKSH